MPHRELKLVPCACAFSTRQVIRPCGIMARTAQSFWFLGLKAVAIAPFGHVIGACWVRMSAYSSSAQSQGCHLRLRSSYRGRLRPSARPRRYARSSALHEFVNKMAAAQRFPGAATAHEKPDQPLYQGASCSLRSGHANRHRPMRRRVIGETSLQAPAPAVVRRPR